LPLASLFLLLNKDKMKLFLSLILGLGFISCQSQSAGKVESISEKENNKNERQDTLAYERVYALPTELDEISGITFLPGNLDVIYAVQDEEGILYAYSLSQTEIIGQYKFAGKGDFEEIATDGESFYVLESKGTIYSFPVDLKDTENKVKIHIDLLQKGEYESMAYDPQDESLMVVCKECKQDKGSPQLTAYRLSILENGDLSLKNKTIVSLEGVTSANGKPVKNLKPSALVKNNLQKKWFLLSSIDKNILILDTEFKPIETIFLNKNQFQQPEGITFDAQQKMYISSEKNNAENALLFQFKN